MKRVKSTAMAVAFLQMAVTTKASGSKIQELVKGVSFTKMEIITQADSWNANETDTVHLSRWVKRFTRGTGKQIT